MDDFNITIVGLGLIGGSYAMALKELHPKNLWAVDIDASVLKTAENEKIIDKGYLNPEIPLENSDIVFICLYPEFAVKFISDNVHKFKKNSVITDTVGVKQNLFEKINKILPDYVDFIGGHPMAGKEMSGFSAASKSIFKNANYIITPQTNNKSENVELIEKIARMIGCKSVVKVSPKKHDELIAYTSQLPHVIASALVKNLSFNEAKSFIGGSFKDATRVARINSELWTELLLDNKENILEQIEMFEKNINLIKNSIKQNDEIKLKQVFEDVHEKMEAALR